MFFLVGMRVQCGFQIRLEVQGIFLTRDEFFQWDGGATGSVTQGCHSRDQIFGLTFRDIRDRQVGNPLK